jgi:hypothetical protein
VGTMLLCLPFEKRFRSFLYNTLEQHSRSHLSTLSNVVSLRMKESLIDTGWLRMEESLIETGWLRMEES